MSEVERITKHVSEYDSCLFAKETKPGRVDIYRKAKFSLSPPHFLFSLTDTWQPTGKPVYYGVEVLMNRIKALDLWRDEKFIENYINSCEKETESKERARKNTIESFLYEFRGQFHKATKDINTSSVKKLYRKEGSHGYCEPRS